MCVSRTKTVPTVNDQERDIQKNAKWFYLKVKINCVHTYSNVNPVFLLALTLVYRAHYGVHFSQNLTTNLNS